MNTPIMVSEMKCSECGKPATQTVNVNISMAGSVPSRFEPRCEDHGWKLPTLCGTPFAPELVAMTLPEAVAVLNERKHGDYDAWTVESDGYVVGKFRCEQCFTAFEAIAIAEKYRGADREFRLRCVLTAIQQAQDDPELAWSLLRRAAADIRVCLGELHSPIDYGEPAVAGAELNACCEREVMI